MLELSIAWQTWVFLYSIALGGLLGLFYDFFRIVRVALPHRPLAVLLEDLVFWTVCTTATFTFFLCMDGGRIRIFLLVGEGIGFVLYYFTVGVLVIGAAKRIIAALKWIFHQLYRLFVQPILFVVRKIGSFLRKKTKNANMHLQKYRRILYNQRKHLEGMTKRQQHQKGKKTNENCKGT